MERPSEPSNGESVRLGFVGDLLLGRRVSAGLRNGKPPAGLWGDFLPVMQAADAVIANLEGPITDHERRWRLPKAFYFRADARAVEALTAGNIRTVALANNHMLDFRTEGLRETLEHLDRAGIAYAGAGPNRAEAAKPAFFTAGGRAIGFASITNTVRSFAAGEQRVGTNFWPIHGGRTDAGKLAALVAELRQGGAEVLILSIHWGPNYRWWPPAHYRAFAGAAIDAGFDIVHGHSAHVLQGAEFRGRGLILYDTADFIDDLFPVPGLPTWRSCFFQVDLKPGATPGLTMIPAHLTPGEVHRAKGAAAERIRNAMRRRCAGLAIRLTEQDGALIGRPPG